LDRVLADHPGQSSALSEPITTNAIPGTLQGPGYEHVVSERRMISRMEIGWIAFFVLVLIGGSIYSGLNFTFDQAVSWFKGGQP
jgi:hypothetical protein